MTLTELIKQLKEVYKAKGDLSVTVNRNADFAIDSNQATCDLSAQETLSSATPESLAPAGKSRRIRIDEATRPLSEDV